MLKMAVVAAMAPAVLWLWYFYRKDKNPEPLAPLALAFVYGLLAIAPVALVQSMLLPHLPDDDPALDFGELLVAKVLVAGLIEEAAKFVAVALLFVFCKDFDEPGDALIYAVAVGLGFTAGEDLLRHWIEVDVARMFRPPGHVLFSALWAYPMGRLLVRPNYLSVIVGFGGAIGLHGLWNAMVVRGHHPEHRHFMIVATAVLAVVLFAWLECQLERSWKPQPATA